MQMGISRDHLCRGGVARVEEKAIVIIDDPEQTEMKLRIITTAIVILKTLVSSTLSRELTRRHERGLLPTNDGLLVDV